MVKKVASMKIIAVVETESLQMEVCTRRRRMSQTKLQAKVKLTRA